MQRLVRLSLACLLSFAVAGLTACGDKVQQGTTTGPPVDSSVHQVIVSPTSATMNIGDKITIGASVVGGAGLTDKTVTWSSSNSAVAAVDNTGTVTALKAGTASITATSHKDPTQSAAAVITVGSAGQAVPATITVSTVNQTVCGTGGCNSVPANLANVSGQIDVTFNVDPGTGKLSEVDLVLNCTGTGNSGKDTVVAKLVESSGNVVPSASGATAPVTISFNTATFNAQTGATAFKNGPCTVKGEAITVPAGSTTPVTTISASQQLTLNNTDVVIVATPLTTTPTAPQLASAVDGHGLAWNAGAVNVTAIPVIYTGGRSIASATINLVNASASPGAGQAGATVAAGGQLASISGITPTAGVFTASFPNSTTAAGGVGGATDSVVVAQVTTVDNAGNNGPSYNLPAVATSSNFIRLDNAAPSTAGITVNFSTQNSQNGWIGAAYQFTTASGFITSTGTANTDNNNTPAVAGSDKVTFVPQFSTAAAPTTWTAITTVSNIPESSSATAYNFRFQVCDVLMNCANTATLGTFGVDVTAPKLSAYNGPKNLEIDGIGQAVTNGGNVTATLTDSSASGSSVTGSGFGGTPLLVSEIKLVPNGASGQVSTCIIGTPSTADANGNTTCTKAALEPNNFSAVTAGDGQYALGVQAIDQAGNTSAPTNVMFFVDQTAPTVSGANISVPGTIATNTAFSASAADNMDVASGNGRLNYAGTGFNFFEPGSASPAGAAFTGTLVRSSTVTVPLSVFYESLASINGAALTAGEKPASINLRAVDAANNLSTATAVAIPAANVAGTGATPYSVGTANTNSMQAFTVASSAGTVSFSATSPNPSSTTLTGTVTAATQQSNTPFTSVCFYYQSTSGTEGGLANSATSGATGDLVLIGCTTTPPADVTTGTTRTFTYSMAWTPSSKIALGAHNVYAVGVNSTTDAVITQPASVTLVQ